MSEEAGFDTWEADNWGQEYDERDDDRSEPNEPNCFACYDSGWVFQFDRDDLARVCRACHPTRFQMFRWRVAGWFNRVRYRRRRTTSWVTWWWSGTRPATGRTSRTAG